MYKWTFALYLGFVAAAPAADNTLALSLRAQGDFGRVETAPLPNVEDTLRCVQSQAEMLPAADRKDAKIVPTLRFRKGFCEILNAALTGNTSEYAQASDDFARAAAAWSSGLAEPLPSGLQVLWALARVKSNPEGEVPPAVRTGLEMAVNQQACSGGLMSGRLCQELIDTGRVWLGWMALRRNDLAAAESSFRFYPALGWQAWAAGQQAIAARQYSAAVEALQKAVDAWENERKYPSPGMVHILGPKPDIAAAWAELGNAQYLAGQSEAALASLDRALKQRPGDARSIYVRGLAKEALGRKDGAIADYQLASRTAFANADEPSASAEAHFYRGVWLFRRKSYGQAENEFSSALNAAAGTTLAPDAAAWRQMAAVADGSCAEAAGRLRGSLESVTDFFPRGEARGWLAGCTTPPANTTRNEEPQKPSM